MHCKPSLTSHNAPLGPSERYGCVFDSCQAFFHSFDFRSSDASTTVGKCIVICYAYMQSKSIFILTRHETLHLSPRSSCTVSRHVLRWILAPHINTNTYNSLQYSTRPDRGATALKFVDFHRKRSPIGRYSAFRRSQCVFRNPTRWVR